MMARNLRGGEIVLLLLPGIGLLALTFGLPLYWAVVGSVGLSQDGHGFSLDYLQAIFTRPLYRNGLKMSLYYSLVPTAITLLMAIPLAMLLQKPFFGRKLFNGLYKLPLAVPGIIAAFMVLTLVEQGGFFDRILMNFGLRLPRMVRDSYGIAVLITGVWKDLPFMTLIITGAFGAIPRDLVLAARTMGASRLKAFVHVELPLALPGITAATLLCFVNSLGAFAAPSLLGPTYPLPLSILMYDAYQLGDWNMIYAMGTVLIAAAFLVLLAYYALISMVGTPNGRKG